MAASSTGSRKSRGPVLRSLSPCGRYYGGCGSGPLSNSSSYSSSSSSSSAFAASSTSATFSSRFISRPASPTRVSLYSAPSPSSAVRFSIDRATSPNRSISTALPVHPRSAPKKTCLCSPTNHPGSFRCSLHKSFGPPRQHHQQSAGPYQSNRLFARRSAMTNSLVRIGTVEGDLVKRALAALIRPSSHHQRRRADFQPRPSRLSIMSRAQHL